jgi:acylphosphatase
VARAVIGRRVGVRGRVQGVFFRDSTRREARRRGVAGWVTNRADGSVEAVFEGEPGAVEALVAWAARGPVQARVTDQLVTAEDPRGEVGFRVV